MIKRAVYKQVLYDTIKKATTTMSKDVIAAFENAIANESSPVSRKGFQSTLQSLELSARRCSVACPDTGWPLFFFKIGNDCELEGGILALEEAAREAVAECTRDGYLRATMKHPITGADPGNNIGMNIPGIMAATAPADMMSHLRSYSPTRDANETGSVLLLEVVNMTANKYSFQELMNT